ncbi:MAG TPA: enoyl-CoA hydratase-related protein [Pusillimonas sp.]|uniref:enoyl-CoA hydratase/isomerase family protein n=1 Tax=Pusillimonas sp. TaxID=3040095 RepID=UPI002B90D2A3|nr:enoyl-CoA hydratase-related protein [Pusillimonas sp.]HUH87056.1 enoyl-CoA hydratase-related protein [Pusillimonas sp.]
MAASVLQYEKQEYIATITLNRPEARNALTPEMLCRLADALIDVRNDSSVRVVILAAAGDKAFCAGGDLAKTLPLLTGDRQPQDQWDERLLNDPQVIPVSSLCDLNLNKPVVAAVNGACVAAGAELLLGTDIRIASRESRFAWPEVQRGLIPFAGSLSRLPAQLPYCHAMELMLTGDAIDAQKALELGLINYVVHGPEVLPLAQRLAARIAQNAPLAVAEIKKAAVASMGLPQHEAFMLEKQAYQRVMATEDAREGPRAFMERRAPVYRGQ